jgi:hypothetical protein
MILCGRVSEFYDYIETKNPFIFLCTYLEQPPLLNLQNTIARLNTAWVNEVSVNSDYFRRRIQE